MRLAFYSPLNPVPSGISDYAEELLPLLDREFDIDLVVEGYRPSNPALAAWRLITPAELHAHASRYDVILYHMGNSPAHDSIYRTLLRVPGVVVLHDLVLHHLRAWQTIDRRDFDGYLEALRADYGEAGAELARLEASGLAGLNRFDYPLNGDVTRAARALIVHSEYAATRLQPQVPQTAIAVVPMGIPRASPLSMGQARARLHLPGEAFIIAAFGEIHPHKRVTVALQAFADFHKRDPRALLLLIGRESPNYDVAALIRLLGLEESVRLVGFAPRDDYERYIAAADLCLNLRYPTAGETSAALLRLFAAGKAVVVTRTGSYADLPDGVCAKIDADEYEQDSLAALFQLFAARPELLRQLGDHARAFAQECHTLDQSAAAYADFLRAVVAGRAQSRSYLVTWSRRGDTEKGRHADDGIKCDAPEPRRDAGQDDPASREHADDSNPCVAPPHRAPPAESIASPDSPTPTNAKTGEGGEPTDFADSIAYNYAELGLDPTDPVLRDVAQALADLGLTEGEG